MAKFNYTDDEKEINAVLNYHDKLLKEMQEKSSSLSVEGAIDSSEQILRELGYHKELDALINKKTSDNEIAEKKVICIPDWDNLVNEAQSVVGLDNTLEDLFSEEELKANALKIKQLNDDYNAIHRLDKNDVAIAAVASILGAIVDIVLVGIPSRGPDGLEAGSLSDFIRDKFNQLLPPDQMEKLANSKKSKVSFDAQDNRNTTIRVEGLSSFYHRLLELGHDPLLGFIFGVYDILHGTMTTIDKNGKIVCQVMSVYADRKETNIVAAIIKQINHLKSDVTTSMGLPMPLMSLFNLLQFGSIGEEEQTIAEIVQGMYYEGFDFIHFCSQSMSVIVVELVVRIGYSIKRIKEGNKIKDSIPISLDRTKHPKLATMLFVAHSGATAINAGKVFFAKNPLAINYAQWMKFFKVSYKQLKWVIIEKPNLRDKYVCGIVDSELLTVINDTNELFDAISDESYIIFE